MVLLYNYFNKPLQYSLYCDFYGNKRQVVALFLFLLKHRLWTHTRTASLSAHTFCFRTEKKEYIK